MFLIGKHVALLFAFLTCIPLADVAANETFFESVASMGFASVVIARPSLLDGAREALGQPPRMSERVGLHLMRGLKGLIPGNYRAIAAQDVAQALVDAVRQGTPGVVTLLSGDMQGAAAH
jgi:uncharacterized protein YbjT (DUF2867 family)